MAALDELFDLDSGPFEPPVNEDLLRSIEAELGVQLPDA